MFELATVRKFFPLETKTKPAMFGGAISWTLPRTGYLASIFVHMPVVISGTLSAPNALGVASVIRRIRLTAQGGVDLFNVSGVGYFWCVAPNLDTGYIAGLPSTDPYSAVTASTFDLSFVIPLRVNDREQAGLVLLQGEETLLTLTIEFESDSVVATGATITASATPFVEIYTVPVNKEDWPDISIAHVFAEDQQSISLAGQVSYEWPRGDVYIRTTHLLGAGASPADNWSRAVLRVNESDVLNDITPGSANMLWYKWHKAARRAAVIPFDMISTTGLGNYGSLRDAIDTNRLSSLKSVVTATSSGVLFTVREMLSKVRPG